MKGKTHNTVGCNASERRRRILDTYHPDTLYSREKRREDQWLFVEAKRGPRTKKLLGEIGMGSSEVPSVC